MLYVRRLLEFTVFGFLAGAVPVWLQNPSLDRVALHGAIGAGLVSLYGLLTKRIGDVDRPGVM